MLLCSYDGEKLALPSALHRAYPASRWANGSALVEARASFGLFERPPSLAVGFASRSRLDFAPVAALAAEAFYRAAEKREPPAPCVHLRTPTNSNRGTRAGVATGMLA